MGWIESNGGPLLLAAASLVPQWRGTRPSLTDTNTTDYDRACAVEAVIDTLRLGEREAIVFGDEPDRTSLITESAHQLLIVRWRWATSERGLLSAIRACADKFIYEDCGYFHTFPGKHLLFDSAQSGDDVHTSLVAILEFDSWKLETTRLESAEFGAVIHRLACAS